MRSGCWDGRQAIPETRCHAAVCIELARRRAGHLFDHRSLIYCRSHGGFGLGCMVLEIVMRQIELSYAPLIQGLFGCGRSESAEAGRVAAVDDFRYSL